jgi:hypothetical protein
VTQVTECLPAKSKTLNSNHSTIKKEKKKKEKNPDSERFGMVTWYQNHSLSSVNNLYSQG